LGTTIDVRAEPICLNAPPHLFVSISENFVGARKQTNCADEAQDRDFRPIRGDFDLEAASARRGGGADHMTYPVGVPTIHRETQ